MGVGEPLPTTKKGYPVCRSECTHEDSAGQTYLQAQGCQKRCPTLQKMVPMYLWVCRACGARWQRIRVDTPPDSCAQAQNQALQPTLTPSCGMRVRVKREAPETGQPARPSATEPPAQVRAVEPQAHVEEVTMFAINSEPDEGMDPTI